MNPHERIVVALDVETGDEALQLVDALRGEVGLFKVGKQLFTAAGPELVRRIVALGERVFLDLKYHDIPATVAKASIEAVRLGVSILNVHAAGGREMLRHTAETVTEFCEREGRPRPTVLAVTVLTSLDDELLAETGIGDSAATHVVRLAKLARDCGIDGVVASPLEIEVIRQKVARENFVVLTPGIRPSGSAKGDQKRVMTPAEALVAGSDYLVIGRPITGAPDPIGAARSIVAELEEARRATM
jgi:orotidine-5'-phosphate decarboxylase